MHELALSRGVIEAIEGEAQRQAFSRVTRVVVEIGMLSHVDPSAMAFCFDQVCRGTVAEGAALEIREPKGRALCLDCEATVEIARRGEACPQCRGFRLMAVGGEELRLKELEVA